MLLNKSILEIIQKDNEKNRRVGKRPRLFGDEVWKYQILLRCAEYYVDKKGIYNKIFYYFYKWRLHNLGIKLGFSIPLNTCGHGLQLMHAGTIVINDKARIGNDCRIHVCVNIGEDVKGQAPVIGNNVYIGPGAKIFGGIRIADNIIIGANAVVNKTFMEEGITIAGIPAKIIKNNSSDKGNY